MAPYLGAEFEIIFDDLYRGTDIRSIVRDITGVHKFYTTTGDDPSPEFGSVSEVLEDHAIVVPGSNVTTRFVPDSRYNNARVRDHYWHDVALRPGDYDDARHRDNIRHLALELAKQTGGEVKLARWEMWPQDVATCKPHQAILTTTLVSGHIRQVCPIGGLACDEFVRTRVVPVILL